MIYQFFDLLATVLEGALMIDVTAKVAGPRYEGKKQIAVQGILCIVYTLVIVIMNQIQVFFFTTMVAAICNILLATISTRGNLRLKCIGCVLVFFLLHTLDAVIGFSCVLFMKQSADVYQSFIMIMQPGITRIIYTIVNKTIQISFYLILRSYLKRIKELSIRSQWMMMVAFLGAYLMVLSLLYLIVSESLYLIQVAVIISWISIFICMIVGMIGIVLSNQYYNKKRDAQLLAVTNEMLEKNYVQLSENQKMISKQVHDFNHHIKTLKGISNDYEAMQQYVNELWSAPYESVGFCQSGNRVLDAIMNCKKIEAEMKSIDLAVEVECMDSLMIPSIDICAVLSNQLDNALEACERIEEYRKRFVRVKIGMNYNFVVFQVENSVAEDPFKKGKLRSKKENALRLHGNGLRNIEETAEKNGGSLRNWCKDNVFTSVVMMQSR